MTNDERIRAMTDAELADFIAVLSIKYNGDNYAGYIILKEKLL